MPAIGFPLITQRGYAPCDLQGFIRPGLQRDTLRWLNDNLMWTLEDGAHVLSVLELRSLIRCSVDKQTLLGAQRRETRLHLVGRCVIAPN